MAKASRNTIIDELKKSYCMELETVTNYLAHSINLDGVRAEEIKKALAVDINEELTHARQLGELIKQLDGFVPGSLSLSFEQKALQPPKDTTDVTSVIEGVIKAEEDAHSTIRPFVFAKDRTMLPRTSLFSCSLPRRPTESCSKGS